MERHDARKAGNVGEKGGDAVVVATNLQVERAFDEVLLTRRRTQSNEVDGELVVDSSFADAVDERRHFGPGRQHLLQRFHPGLELLHLPPDGVEVGRPEGLAAELPHQLDLLIAHPLQLLLGGAYQIPVHAEKDTHEEKQAADQMQRPRPDAGLLDVQLAPVQLPQATNLGFQTYGDSSETTSTTGICWRMLRLKRR